MSLSPHSHCHKRAKALVKTSVPRKASSLAYTPRPDMSEHGPTHPEQKKPPEHSSRLDPHLSRAPVGGAPAARRAARWPTPSPMTPVGSQEHHACPPASRASRWSVGGIGGRVSAAQMSNRGGRSTWVVLGGPRSIFSIFQNRSPMVPPGRVGHCEHRKTSPVESISC